MIPLILDSPSRDATEALIAEQISKHHLNELYITRFDPEGKEFSIKQIRELIKATVYAPSEPRLFILYSFDTASIEAQNALLKTLEEHNPYDLFVMEATQPNRLLPTILSRSQVIHAPGRLSKKPAAGEGIEQAFQSKTPPLNHPVFQVTKYENPIEPFDLLIEYVRSRLATNPRASHILREILITRSRVRENNLNPQYALDRVLIFIYKQK
ncbi:hypothetical protein HYS00_05135 [Candidatus Microgenomates bacterium]|nr:hypothetical protein [Candidatus Microgenomates bacterium]